MDELKDIYGSKIMNRVKKVHESKDIPGFIDIHCHVLPMVDDGAQSTEMALDMLRIAADEGIWKMILTLCFCGNIKRKSRPSLTRRQPFA